VCGDASCTGGIPSRLTRHPQPSSSTTTTATATATWVSWVGYDPHKSKYVLRSYPSILSVKPTCQKHYLLRAPAGVANDTCPPRGLPDVSVASPSPVVCRAGWVGQTRPLYQARPQSLKLSSSRRLLIRPSECRLAKNGARRSAMPPSARRHRREPRELPPLART
jgi:hypothetical protein